MSEPRYKYEGVVWYPQSFINDLNRIENNTDQLEKDKDRDENEPVPVYYVESIQPYPGADPDEVIVYEVTGDYKHPMKAYEQVDMLNKPTYNNSSRLGKLANVMTNEVWKQYEQAKSEGMDVNYRVKREKNPLFSSVIKEGRDTFSREVGLGFEEKTPAVFNMESGKYIRTGGEPTGVFISLERIHLIKTTFVTEDVLNNYLIKRTLFNM